MLRNRKGFTLIELLIVIVIIGILAGIVVGIVGTSARRKANDTKRKADFHELQNALEQYYVDNQAYPTVAQFNDTDTATNVLVKGSYLKETPDAMAKKVSATTTYTYTQGTTADYKVTVLLENQADNGPNTEGTDPAKVYFIQSKQ